MAGTTPNRLYPYPTLGDRLHIAGSPDDPGDLQLLAEAIDDDVCAISAGLTGRPVARFRGTGTFASPSTSAPLSPPPSDTFYRVPFDTEDFNTANITMQSQEVGNRLLFPEDPGFYFAVATVYVPVLTVAGATVNYMGLQIRKGTIATPTALAGRVSGSSHNLPVSATDDRGVRLMSVSAGIYMNGTTDAFCVEWRADTTPDVAEYVINERTITILKMTQS
jgi:hypothetical protein